MSSSDPGTFLRMLTLSAVFMLVTFVVFAAYGPLPPVRERVISRPAVMIWLRRVFAGPLSRSERECQSLAGSPGEQ